jgi:hypothetical protein
MDTPKCRYVLHLRYSPSNPLAFTTVCGVADRVVAKSGFVMALAN